MALSTVEDSQTASPSSAWGPHLRQPQWGWGGNDYMMHSRRLVEVDGWSTGAHRCGLQDRYTWNIIGTVNPDPDFGCSTVHVHVHRIFFLPTFFSPWCLWLLWLQLLVHPTAHGWSFQWPGQAPGNPMQQWTTTGAAGTPLRPCHRCRWRSWQTQSRCTRGSSPWQVRRVVAANTKWGFPISGDTPRAGWFGVTLILGHLQMSWEFWLWYQDMSRWWMMIACDIMIIRFLGDLMTYTSLARETFFLNIWWYMMIYRKLWNVVNYGCLMIFLGYNSYDAIFTTWLGMVNIPPIKKWWFGGWFVIVLPRLSEMMLCDSTTIHGEEYIRSVISGWKPMIFVAYVDRLNIHLSTTLMLTTVYCTVPSFWSRSLLWHMLIRILVGTMHNSPPISSVNRGGLWISNHARDWWSTDDIFIYIYIIHYMFVILFLFWIYIYIYIHTLKISVIFC